MFCSSLSRVSNSAIRPSSITIILYNVCFNEWTCQIYLQKLQKSMCGKTFSYHGTVCSYIISAEAYMDTIICILNNALYILNRMFLSLNLSDTWHNLHLWKSVPVMIYTCHISFLSLSYLSYSFPYVLCTHWTMCYLNIT